MTSSAEDFDPHDHSGSEERPRADSDIALVKVGNVVEAIDLINTIEASIFDHVSRTTKPFFSWLE